MSRSIFEALVTYRKEQHKRRELRCPHCDHIVIEWYEEIDGGTSDEFSEWEDVHCSHCDRGYKARVRTLLDFETEKE